MKTLYLVRHAKSSWDNLTLADFDRPLNKRGEKDAPEMGKRLALRNITPQRMLSSPANRAYTTARKIAEALSIPEKNIKTDEALFHASAREILKVIGRQHDAIDSLMVFGHNPGFTDVANVLNSDHQIDNLPTCGIVAYQMNITSWSDVRQGVAELLFFDYPKKVSETKFLS